MWMFTDSKTRHILSKKKKPKRNSIWRQMLQKCLVAPVNNSGLNVTTARYSDTTSWEDALLCIFAFIDGLPLKTLKKKPLKPSIKKRKLYRSREKPKSDSLFFVYSITPCNISLAEDPKKKFLINMCNMRQRHMWTWDIKKYSAK